MKFSKLKSQHVVLISHKFHVDWPHCYKTIRGKAWVLTYAYRQVYACKSNGRFFRHLDKIMDSFNSRIFWWMYMQVPNSCKSYGKQADGFYADKNINAWTPPPPPLTVNTTFFVRVGSLLVTWLTLIPTLISNHINHKVWNETAAPLKFW